jgi:hypothetical protein
MYRKPGNRETRQNNDKRRIPATTRHGVRTLRHAAHVIEIVGADRQITPGDIALVLLRPVNKRDPHAAAEKITDIRRYRRAHYATAAADHLVLNLDVELRAQATRVLSDRRCW